jgi:hypothetical protein
VAVKFAIIRRQVPGCSRQQDDTYVNVVHDVRSTSGTWEALLTHSVFSDPGSNEFVVQLTEAEYDTLSAPEGLRYSENANLPKWQQRVATNGATKEFGSFATPTNAGSAWSTNPLADDRLIVRIYNGNPGSGGVHIASEDLDEETVTGFVTRHIKLFTAADVASGTNAQNSKVAIAGKNMIFDFTAGVSTVFVSTRLPGVIEFPSNHSYRVVGPSGEKVVRWTIYGRTLTVS